jgi:hypothetical protein
VQADNLNSPSYTMLNWPTGPALQKPKPKPTRRTRPIQRDLLKGNVFSREGEFDFESTIQTNNMVVSIADQKSLGLTALHLNLRARSTFAYSRKQS